MSVIYEETIYWLDISYLPTWLDMKYCNDSSDHPAHDKQITRGSCVRKTWKPPSSRLILIYFEFRSKSSLITVICMDPHSPNKLNARRWHQFLFLIISLFFFFFSFSFLLFYVISNFHKKYFIITILLFFFFFFFHENYFYFFMFRDVPECFVFWVYARKGSWLKWGVEFWLLWKVIFAQIVFHKSKYI